jgi:toxin HigB-1
MIRSFRTQDTELLFRLERVRRWANIERVALRKLVQLDLAQNLSDMRVPPGNRLEALSGDRKGQWSIRINDQYRICFYWTDEGPTEVEIVDYH